MTENFAFKWAIGSAAFFAVASIVGIIARAPLPPSTPACFAGAALVGAIIVGPIVYVSIRRS